MTLPQATAYFINLGPHRGQHLAVVALHHPEYVTRLADSGAPECPIGCQMHEAMVLVADRLRAIAEDDISEGRTVDPHAFSAASAHNAPILARAAAEIVEERAVGGKRGRGGKKASASASASTTVPAGGLFGE